LLSHRIVYSYIDYYNNLYKVNQLEQYKNHSIISLTAKEREIKMAKGKGKESELKLLTEQADDLARVAQIKSNQEEAAKNLARAKLKYDNPTDDDVKGQKKSNQQEAKEERLGKNTTYKSELHDAIQQALDVELFKFIIYINKTIMTTGWKKENEDRQIALEIAEIDSMYAQAEAKKSNDELTKSNPTPDKPKMGLNKLARIEAEKEDANALAKHKMEYVNALRFLINKSLKAEKTALDATNEIQSKMKKMFAKPGAKESALKEADDAKANADALIEANQKVLNEEQILLKEEQTLFNEEQTLLKEEQTLLKEEQNESTAKMGIDDPKRGINRIGKRKKNALEKVKISSEKVKNALEKVNNAKAVVDGLVENVKKDREVVDGLVAKVMKKAGSEIKSFSEVTEDIKPKEEIVEPIKQLKWSEESKELAIECMQKMEKMNTKPDDEKRLLFRTLAIDLNVLLAMA
jgi:hypothetical protein